MAQACIQSTTVDTVSIHCICNDAAAVTHAAAATTFGDTRGVDIEPSEGALSGPATETQTASSGAAQKALRRSHSSAAYTEAASADGETAASGKLDAIAAQAEVYLLERRLPAEVAD